MTVGSPELGVISGPNLLSAGLQLFLLPQICIPVVYLHAMQVIRMDLHHKQWLGWS